MTPASLLEQLPASSRPAWQLYTDWCAATGVAAMPAPPQQLQAFLRDVPAAFSTSAARVRVIRAAHTITGIPFPDAPTPISPALRTGAEWANVETALQALPLTRYPAGLVGRRDALVLLLLDHLHLTRESARAVRIADVDLTRWRLAGTPLPATDSTVACSRCILTRWLRVLGPAALGFRTSVRELLDPAAFTDEHDCTAPLEDTWSVAPNLLPAIDRHGWLTNTTISTRTISTLTARRQDPALPPAHHRPRLISPSSRPSLTLQALADAYDDLDERLTALLLRTDVLLATTPPAAPLRQVSDRRAP
ncbi:hypothetical protein MT355_19410 [Rathayibacter sp. VKM Ac-2929]|uniref:hypothetical protein n=1 Tax=Rathayibacter sp. VKM Ac-2929 TaxID=2929480 RepID=UPI001FB55876|nr:hypothetical protein [Rathayibacter sp. VKM Ac-2929]MCJ1675437.1 hypothetical protein [Rathayibacter sp. VKM Ac-2929]